MEEFETIEEIQIALNEEMEEWNKAGLSLENLQMGAIAPLLLDMQAKIQALVNVLVLTGLVSEADINFQYKKIILNDMKALRASVPEAEKEAIRRQILNATRIPMQPNGKLPWER